VLDQDLAARDLVGIALVVAASAGAAALGHRTAREAEPVPI